MFIKIEKIEKGYTVSARVHFCKHCGYIGFTFLKHSVDIVFYAIQEIE